MRSAAAPSPTICVSSAPPITAIATRGVEIPAAALPCVGNTVFEGRLVNRGNGTYKGFPLLRSEWPKGIEDWYVED